MFHIDFVSYVTIILARCTDLHATKPLLSYFATKLIVSLDGLILSNRSMLLLEITFFL
jgi:hypothetical protein